MSKSNKPAFPVMGVGDYANYATGLTKREWFAGMALQGFLAGNPDIQPAKERAAIMAFEYADSMLAESVKA